MQCNWGPLENLMNAGLPPVDSRVKAKSLVQAVAKAAYAALSPSFSSELNDALVDLHSGKTIGLHLQNVPCSFVPSDWTSGDLYFTKQHLIQLAVNYSLIGDHQLELESRFLMGSNRNSVELLKPWFIPNGLPLPPHWDRIPTFSLAGLCSDRVVETRFFSCDQIVQKNLDLAEMLTKIDGENTHVFERDRHSGRYRLHPTVHHTKSTSEVFSPEGRKFIVKGVDYENFFIGSSDIIFFSDADFLHESVYNSKKPDPSRLLSTVSVRWKTPDSNTTQLTGTANDLAEGICDAREMVCYLSSLRAR